MVSDAEIKRLRRAIHLLWVDDDFIGGMEILADMANVEIPGINALKSAKTVSIFDVLRGPNDNDETSIGGGN